ncbi:MAG: cytochrome P450 [Thermoleophilaceae bacterium]
MTDVAVDAAPSALPPGPRALPAANLFAWLSRPIPTLERCQRRYGDVFAMDFGQRHGRFVFVADPGLIREVFTEKRDSFVAGAPNSVLSPIVGTGSVLTTDGARHVRQRKLLLPPFHGERLEAYRSRIRALADTTVAAWPENRAFAVADSFQRMALQVIVDVVFGVSDEERRRRLLELLPLLTRAATTMMFFPVLERDLGPLSVGGRVKRLREAVDELIHAEIAAHRSAEQAGRPGDDILAMLIAARDEHGESLSDEELRDELMTLLFAGHETTATALAWAVDLVLQHPRVHGRLVEELRTNGDTYLDAVIQETHRFRPTVPNVVREATEDVELGGWLVPAGDVVSPAIHLVHRRADLYPEPDVYRPERFLDSRAETYGWLPFGGGIRRCIGASLAQLEMRETLRVVFERVQLDAATPGRAERPKRRTVTSVPARGTRVIARRRAERLQRQ